MYAYLEQSNRKNFLLHKSCSAKLSIPPPQVELLNYHRKKCMTIILDLWVETNLWIAACANF